MWRGYLLKWMTAPKREDPKFRLVRWEMLVTLSTKIGSSPFQKRDRTGGMAGAVIALSLLADPEELLNQGPQGTRSVKQAGLCFAYGKSRFTVGFW